ncbi:MAG: NTP/NDP exchange transporter [Rickettsiaceae bacterium]|nr:NTP/NDP exchange transporter [Rickettsiaceae bacterium]
MTTTNINTSKLAELKKIFWPIEWQENKKFLPMAMMMFFILFNYSALRSIKDGLIVTVIGAEAISFTKTYVVLPSAILMMIGYAKLCNILSQEKVFYTVVSFFVGFFALFALVLYPNSELFHPNPETIESLSTAYPNFQWFIRIGGNWSYAMFYAMSELWGSMILTLLFWQFANKITRTTEAKRFYSMFGMLGNVALLLLPVIFQILSSDNVDSKEMDRIPTALFVVIMFNGIMIMVIYKWINSNVLTDPNLYDPSNVGVKKKKKTKLSLSDSFKMIFTSKYLGLVVMLVLAYGISINLVEGIWKSKIKEMYPTAKAYTNFMAQFQGYQGITAIFFMLVGSNILRRVKWKTAAIFTPMMILFTGLIFFSLIFFDSSVGLYAAVFFGTNPLALAVYLGMIQNVLSKATKYSLFDSTKEMSYIPLDIEMQTKGKAAVDVIGGRFGKSGGGVIQSTFFVLLPTFTFVEATPYFAAIFFVIVIIWLFAVQALSKEYQAKITEQKKEAN